MAIIYQFHHGMLASVQDNLESSAPFPVSNGVQQGCVLAPTLFSLMFSAMLTDAFRDSEVGTSIGYRYNGHFSTSGGFNRYHQWLPVCWWLCLNQSEKPVSFASWCISDGYQEGISFLSNCTKKVGNCELHSFSSSVFPCKIRKQGKIYSFLVMTVWISMEDLSSCFLTVNLM